MVKGYKAFLPDWTYADVFEKVKDLSIEETDIDLEY